MKPIHLNLASRPYRDYRPVYAVVAALSLLIAFLMLNNVDTYYRYIHDTRATRAKIAAANAEAAQERKRTETVNQQLRRLDLVQLDAQTRFINEKLEQRAFSWSMLLDELESVLADDVRILAIAPSFDKKGQISLGLNFEAKSPQGMIATIDAMNRDPQFRNPFPSSETLNDAGSYTFGLSVQYLPATQRLVAR